MDGNTTLPPETRWLQDEPTGKVAKLRHRASQTLRGIHRKNTWQALNLKRYGAESRNLILSAICEGSQHRFMPMSLSLILARRG
ncbi:hypothetical protein LCE28_00560 (plasmid) [Escherichia coli]|nr:hypothetical protein LCE28_00560 [Escherichia coli]